MRSFPPPLPRFPMRLAQGDANIFIPRNALALGAVRGGVPQYFFALEGLLFFMVFVSGYCVFRWYRL